MGHQESAREARRYAHQGGDPIQFSNSEFQSLTSSLTRSPGPPCIQINVQDAYKIGFGRFTYA
jgi:hypothetical protein